MDVLATASAVPQALAAEQSEERKTSVRHRVQQSLGGSPAEGRARSAWRKSPLRRLLQGSKVPAWRFRAVSAAAAVMAAALVSVGVWHRPVSPPVPVRVVKVPQGVTGIEPMGEQTAHTLLPRMIHNQLDAQQEKNLMWHMLVCPGCYKDYNRLKQQSRSQRPGERLVLR